MLIAQKITHLLGGVSEAPNTLRDPTQLEEQINAVAHKTRGLIRRPPSRHMAKLDNSTAGWDGVYMHTINRDLDERFRVIVKNGDLVVYDLDTGAIVPLYFNTPDKSYLNLSTGYTPATEIRCLTVGDETFIVNRQVTVASLPKKSPDLANEALLHIRQADFSTLYSVKIDGLEIQYATVDATAPQSRNLISTEVVAGDITSALTGKFPDFVFTQYGSTIHMARTDGADFTLEVYDGLGDQGLKAFKHAVQFFDDLPAKAPSGYVVKVTGDPANSFDDYWVSFDDTDAALMQGVWREVVEPGALVALDASTMPHVLVRGGEYIRKLPNEQALSGFSVSDVTQEVSHLGWYLPGGGGLPPIGIDDPYPDPVLDNHGSTAQSTLRVLPSGLVGVHLNGLFSIDTSNVQPGTGVTVQIAKNTGAGTGFTDILHTQEFQAGQTLQDQQWSADNVQVANGHQLQISLNYTGGVTPPPSNVATLNPGNAQRATPSVIVNQINEKKVDFGANTYPAGTLTLTVAGTAYTYSPNGDTAAQVASHYNSVMITAGYNTTLTGSVLTIASTTGNIPPTVTLTSSWGSGTTFFNSTLALTPSAQVGRILKNYSDGSTGTITANGVNTITVGSMTGGADNLIENDDLCAVVGSGDYFIFDVVPWREREVGNFDVNPWPSFMGKTIRTPLFSQNRLGFTTGESVVFSGSGDLFNFFRTTATKVLASDMIDMTSAYSSISTFNHAIQWNSSLYLIAENAQFEVTGDPLTPQTAGLYMLASFPCDPNVPPIANGRHAFLFRQGRHGMQVLEIWPRMAYMGSGIVWQEVTKDVPSFITGQPISVACDPAYGALVILTDGGGEGRNHLWVYSFYDLPDESRAMASWGRWDLDVSATIVGMAIVDGIVDLVVMRPDGVYVEQIDLDMGLNHRD